MNATCSCGRRVVRVYGNGGLGVIQVAQFDRDDDGRCVLVGPFGTPGQLRHVDNTPACPLTPGDPT